VIDWLLRNRQTGEITVAQLPNVPLIVFLLAAGSRWIFHPSGTVGTIVGVVAAIALIAWAGDEIICGINPWRRILGGAALASAAVGVLLHYSQ
jgi:predicted neutral ceramidase superfamily lipid hydrolase